MLNQYKINNLILLISFYLEMKISFQILWKKN